MKTQTVGIHLLTLDHADAIQRLASDPALAANTRLPHPYPAGAAREFVESRIKAREDGSAWCFAIVDRKELVGVIGLEGIEGDTARELGYWIGKEYWGKGYASFAVKMVLEFAFRNLRLHKVCSAVFESNGASRRVLEKNGFQLIGMGNHHDASLKKPDEKLASYVVDRSTWQEAINRPVLSSLHPVLRTILTAELVAGNELLETGSGWPDPDSVFVRLRHPFRTPSCSLPPGIRYTELNDPHWWKAEFSSHSPRHILAC